MANATLQTPLSGRLHGHNGVLIRPLEEVERIVVRANGAAVGAVGKAIGTTLPKKPNTSSSKGDLVALWVGPDEWLVSAPVGTGLAGKAEKATGTYSVVDVEHRNTGVLIEGEKAVLTLNSGCPRDLSLEAFPVGACARTMLGKAEVILYRQKDSEFRIECWRSFSDYVWKYLVAAARCA